MFDSALGIMMAIGPFILVVALIYAVLQYRHRRKLLDGHRERTTRRMYTDESAQQDHLTGESGARPSGPTPNDIT